MERFANGEPVPGARSRTCPEARSHVDVVRAAHFAQDDIGWLRSRWAFCEGLVKKKRDQSKEMLVPFLRREGGRLIGAKADAA